MANDKIRLAVATSLREILVDELVSRVVIDPESGQDYGYRMGNIEHIARILADPRGNNHPLAQKFADAFELAMIFHDDIPLEYEAARALVKHWPFDIKVPVDGAANAVPLEALVTNIQSKPWRRIEDPETKGDMKKLYESRLLSSFRQRHVDLIISDSYLIIFAPIMLHGYWQTILNIHPAITDPHDENRLPGVTPTRDAYTRAKYGWVIVDDKRRKETWPNINPIYIDYNGEKRLVVPVPKSRTTGVTVHIVDDLVDHGEVVLCRKHEFPEGTTYEGIRDRNYGIKREILPEALLEYVGRSYIQNFIDAQRSRWFANRQGP